MRDIVAAFVAIFLILSALSLGTALHTYRRKRQRARDSEGALGRTIIAEIPASSDLALFSADTVRFPDGSVGELDIVRHPGASAIVPFVSDPLGDNPQILLLKQYRYAADQYLYETLRLVRLPGLTRNLPWAKA